MDHKPLDVAIVGAGPYGLSLAAHLGAAGISFAIFGRPMNTWISDMPAGMYLKSEGFASDLYDPARKFRLRDFCAERGIPYADEGMPIPLDVFSSYGEEFQRRLVPGLDRREVASVDEAGDGFELRLEDGALVRARRVVLAVGISHFDYIPEQVAHLPRSLVTHSAAHSDLGKFHGTDVTVIGAGASALELAVLLHEAGARVRLIARAAQLKFHSPPPQEGRSLWQEIRHPRSGLGPGWRSLFIAEAPGLFARLPTDLRRWVLRRHLGPSGGWFLRERFAGNVETLLGSRIATATPSDGGVTLDVMKNDGSTVRVETAHVIAATGYRPELDRLTFVSQELRDRIRTLDRAPVLSSSLESSVPGLYFMGLAASVTFGPAMRFAFGAKFAAPRLASRLIELAAAARSGQRPTAPVAGEAGWSAHT